MNLAQSIQDTLEAAAKCRPLIYPGYIGSFIKRILMAQPDPQDVIRSVGDMETIGDCRYAIKLTDFNGTEYRVTIEAVTK